MSTFGSVDPLGPLLRSARDIILILDAGLRVIDANTRAVQAYGYDITELRQLTLRDLTAPDHQRKLIERQPTWESVDGANYETVHRRKNGSLFPVDVSVAAAVLEGDRHYVKIVRDITRRKNDELRLRILNAAITAAPSPVIITDAEFRVEWVNRAFLCESGYALDEVIGRNIRTLKSAAPEHTREEELRRELTAGRVWRGEFTNRRTDGSVYIEEATVTPVLDDNGVLTHTVGINTDVTHRRHAELATRQTAERYRVLFEQNPHPMWIYDCDTLEILSVNDAAMRKYGYTREEFVSMTVDALFADAALLHRHLTGTPPAQRLPPARHRTRTGAEFQVEMTCHPLQWVGRKAQLVMAMDVTDRLRAEDALRGSEARFSSAFMNAPIGMGLAALDGRLLLANPALCELLGYTKEELAALTLYQLTHPDDREITALDIRRLTNGEVTVSYRRKRYVTKIGDVVTVLRCASLVRDAAGAPHHFIVQILDVTATTRAEEKLRRQAELLNETSDAIFVTDTDRRITFWNHAAERLTGYAAYEAMMQPAVRIFGPEIEALLVSAVSSGIVPGESRAEWILSHRDGRAITLEARTRLLSDAGRGPMGHITVATDVTENKRLHEQLLHSQRLDSLGLLSAGIAHDLNNVLAPIMLAAPMLRMNAKDPGDIFLLDTLEKAGHRGASLVSQILSFARLPETQAVQVAPKHLLRDVAQVIQQTFPKSVSLEHDIPNDLWLVRANPTHLHQVLLNLCVNARDAMPEGGTLYLRGENRTIAEASPDLPGGMRAGGWVVLTVTDTGTGIPPHVLAHMWEPFFTTKPSGQGTGLGLSTVRGIVEKHGGFITVKTEPSRGTTFSVHLPAMDAPAPVPAAPTYAPRRGGNVLILVAEDEESIRAVAVHILQRHGYAVITAANGVEAIALFRARADDVALVLTDLDMPEAGGLAVAQAVRETRPTTPVLGMSGCDGPDGEPTFGGQFTLFVRKPFTPEILIDHVERALESKRNQDGCAAPGGPASA